MVGESESFLDCLERVSQVARINRPVLIIGERGTGKELVAARLHYLSGRWDRPRIAVNCAAFAPELLESELFGYEAGAFTGAQKRKTGRFEWAHQGTLFLDELAQSPQSLQEKILRVLEYQEFERVGGTETVQVDVRVIAATNANLPELCKQGKFREDLLDRLSFEVIGIPPLRERIGDVPLLSQFFARRMALELGWTDAPQFTQDAMRALEAYEWPGNVRELKNVIERSVCRSDGPIIREIIIDPFASLYGPKPQATLAPVQRQWPCDFNEQTAALERELIQQALTRNQFHQAKAASDLQLGYHQFRRLLKKHDL
ncbi:MAG: phage shock protein operon transcriptional activator [Acidobacteria bacterium]|nr:phage shock protein operon transcriptional activator [Acidobacteriota bacterium]